MDVGVTDDLYAAGAFLGDPRLDLVFKAFVTPVQETLYAPQLLIADSSKDWVAVRWTACPAASSYTILRRALQDAAPAELATVQQPAYTDFTAGPFPDWYYSVRVNAPGGVFVTSTENHVYGIWGNHEVNLGTEAGSFVTLDQQPGQSFVVPQPGILDSIEVSISRADGFGTDGRELFLAVYGPTILVANAAVDVPPAPLPPVLDPVLTMGSRFYFSRPVAAGNYRFELISTAAYRIAEGPDNYAAGTETLAGVPVPGRDLFFKVNLR